MAGVARPGLGGLGNVAKGAYIMYAHAVLPAIVPVGFMLLEPDRRRRRWLLPLVCLGPLLGAYLLWQVTAYPVGAQEAGHCINYTTHTPNDVALALLYVIVTCGPALISSRRYLRWFGVVSLIGVIATAMIRVDESTSLWCLYVAMVSVLILEHFRRERGAGDALGVDSPLANPNVPTTPILNPTAVTDRLTASVAGIRARNSAVRDRPHEQAKHRQEGR